MQSLDVEVNNDRLLYRELFVNADKSFKDIISRLKPDECEGNCCTCCQIRYSPLSPTEIYELSLDDDIISSEYIKNFVPYGTSDNFSYSDNSKVCQTKNNNDAKKTAPEYVDKLLSKTDGPIYFYYCKHLENNKCNCEEKSFICKSFPVSITTVLPEECSYRKWQKQVIDKIKNEIAPDIYLKSQEIACYRDNFKCAKTGTCCRLACSEYSIDELKEKGQNGDNFAKQFSDIFIPYNSIEDARKIYPEYVDYVIEKQGKNEKVYFYHCPHISNDNLCTIYENRPQICKDFPENPLAILPKICGYYKWKEEVSVATMTYHAMIQIYEFYLGKIEDALA